MMLLPRKLSLLCMLLITLSLSAAAFSQTRHFPRGSHDVWIPKVSGVRADLLPHITRVVETSIAEGQYPGAVIWVVHQGKTIYRGVFGHRRLLPDTAPMRFDTLFDI